MRPPGIEPGSQAYSNHQNFFGEAFFLKTKVLGSLYPTVARAKHYVITLWTTGATKIKIRHNFFKDIHTRYN